MSLVHILENVLGPFFFLNQCLAEWRQSGMVERGPEFILIFCAQTKHLYKYVHTVPRETKYSQKCARKVREKVEMYFQ